MNYRLRQTTSLFLLTLFLVALGVKAGHHHHWKNAEDIVCPLDGQTMSHHKLSHTVIYFDDSDNCSSCAICNSNQERFLLPDTYVDAVESVIINIFFVLEAPFTYLGKTGVCLLRAPPVLQL